MEQKQRSQILSSIKMVCMIHCKIISLKIVSQIANSLPPYASVAHPVSKATLGRKTRSSKNATLVLDLDETLISSSCQEPLNYQHSFQLKEEAESYTVFVSVRPFVTDFLEFASNNFEVVVFTAAEKTYADHIINFIDPLKKYIKHRLYRDSCLPSGGAFVKDLNVLGRDLSKTIIVDNAIHSFGYQLENGILIKNYEGGNTDTALLALTEVLLQVKDSDNVCSALTELLQVYPFCSSCLLYTSPSPRDATLSRMPSSA
eukprot:TRINITY_DN2980_c0_g1_i1.p1 TRINITY_DN2980_c0_g1~~TRINITY_DN2980_c0_g1_i1.p1  ORF type:complete len:259 (-),score=23.84 TRINITY_DN2980_c0_g1_i1:11-787(-)